MIDENLILYKIEEKLKVMDFGYPNSPNECQNSYEFGYAKGYKAALVVLKAYIKVLTNKNSVINILK